MSAHRSIWPWQCLSWNPTIARKKFLEILLSWLNSKHAIFWMVKWMMHACMVIFVGNVHIVTIHTIWEIDVWDGNNWVMRKWALSFSVQNCHGGWWVNLKCKKSHDAVGISPHCEWIETTSSPRPSLGRHTNKTIPWTWLCGVSRWCRLARTPCRRILSGNSDKFGNRFDKDEGKPQYKLKWYTEKNRWFLH